VKPNAFVGRTKTPTEADLRAALGAAKAVWDLVVVDMARELGLTHEWKTYGPKFGWALRLKQGKRNIVHLGPCEGCVALLFILGERAVKAARAARLGRAATKLLDEAPHYPEGTGIRLDTVRAKDIPLIKKLATIKLEN
jgi:Protein of unknown function (DUF3788)